jgi:hypothetical protein
MSMPAGLFRATLCKCIICSTVGGQYSLEVSPSRLGSKRGLRSLNFFDLNNSLTFLGQVAPVLLTPSRFLEMCFPFFGFRRESEFSDLAIMVRATD